MLTEKALLSLRRIKNNHYKHKIKMPKETKNTESSNAIKPLLSNRFSHTLENCLFAKNELIKDGFSEEDFYSADEDYQEIGFLIGEPMLKTNDDFCKSALQLYKEKCLTEEEDDDKMIEFFLRNGI